MVLLIPFQSEDRYRKASYDKQLMMLMHDVPESIGSVEQVIKLKEQYKGLEKMLDESKLRISSLQSLMRYAREGGG